MFEYMATVIRIVDGDTVDLAVDLGFRTFFKDRFRLYGIDCPERGQVGWAEAKAALEVLIPVGAQVLVQTHHPRERDERDSFGRWLAEIVTKNGIDVNERMVADGFARFGY